MLSEILKITRGDVVSIVGSGGKTTALSKLGTELCGSYKTLVTSTTKIGINQIYSKAKIFITKDDYSDGFFSNKIFSDKIFSDKIFSEEKPGFHYIMKEELFSEGKLLGFLPDEVDTFAGFFDVILSEADGSRRKFLKGWGLNEPVIAGSTTKILGIINLKLLGEKISGENIHRPEEFCRLTQSSLGDSISFDIIRRVILSPAGLFKNSEKTLRPAEKILFINMVDNDNDKILTEEFLHFIERDLGFFDNLIYGSLLNGSYTRK